MVLGVQHLWRIRTSSLLLGTEKGEVGLVGGNPSEEERKCRKMGVSDGLGPELVPVGAEAGKATLAPGPGQGHGCAAQGCIAKAPSSLFQYSIHCSVPVKTQ